ncbi:hypothetical protein H5087_08240 [Pseudoalteromonas sp. SR43-7]|uniref:hypothetical protein n=1 Tax=Pseudoalteromonas sp. SR43-7 TaxID=2760939 RepID=UPI0015FC05AE|nr:hypothetical protein [Pseudoalteromonas sp. SR43-7]MBB1329342.1 hypothetical protein [Pseudoalteromonas sp. SR43-7]
MRKHKDQQQFFRSIISSKSAAPHNLFVNKSLYELCQLRKQASRLQVKLISTLWGKRRACSREKHSF